MLSGKATYWVLFATQPGYFLFSWLTPTVAKLTPATTTAAEGRSYPPGNGLLTTIAYLKTHFS